MAFLVGYLASRKRETYVSTVAGGDGGTNIGGTLTKLRKMLDVEMGDLRVCFDCHPPIRAA